MSKISIPCELIGLAYEERRELPFVLLRETQSGKVVSFPVNHAEASNIIFSAEGIRGPQPGIHEAFIQLFVKHGYKADYVYIWGDGDTHFYGYLKYRSRFVSHRLEMNPADAISLALRFKIPIMVDATLVAHIPDPDKKERDAAFSFHQVLIFDHPPVSWVS
ncbi:MAG: bifunctional nuclease family protein [Treponemataceae bacterium]|nr:bifunctional nuclease family protein [Treponemataceae bacterium]